jgi:exodeoxyribonuclease V gamma subunit
MEELASALADVVRRPLASAMTEEVIVVSSQGLERWLSQELAVRLGVCANARFPFPRTFIDELIGKGASEEDGPTFDRESLSFAIAALLPEIAERQGAESIAAYLSSDPRGQKRFELARQIAGVFDQYAVYRPDLVAAWERGSGHGWQPDLWRALVDRLGPVHVAARAEEFLAAPLPDMTPERVSLFGISSLPPIYLRLLSRIAKEREVHVFLLSPSPVAEPRHPLAASLGALGRDFEALLMREAEPEVRDRFVAPGDETLLQVLQADLLAGTRRAHGTNAARVQVRLEDESLAVHSCHSPLREVEVLRDQLLAMFEADPTLEPHHVIVMAPDIDAYAPLIDAVFGVDTSDPGYVPYRIADRKVSAWNLVAEALLELLSLAGSRMKASEVLDLLQLDPVQRRFGIDAEEVPELRRLVRESGIRWALDAEHRAAFEQPPVEENTWRFGVRRLLLGQALRDTGEPFHGVLPIETSSDAAPLVGRLSEVVRELETWRDQLSVARTLDDWAVCLRELLGAFVPSEEPHVWGLRAVLESIDALVRRAKVAGFGEPIHREIVLYLLRHEFDRERSTRNFLSGGVTFCALLPMRSIPFRVVYLLGLCDRDFPRTSRSPAFDLVAQRPRAGDRFTRDEDRQLFLEALLSARDRLVLSYVGRAVHDNAEFPPSVVVSELLDVVDTSFTTRREHASQLLLFEPRLAEDGVGRTRILEHPLQAFSPRYFGADDDPRLFGFTAADAAGARVLASRKATRPRFHAKPLVPADSAVVGLDELSRFLENPARALVRRRLGVVLDDEPLLVADREPIELGPLEAYEIGARLFERALREGRTREAVSWARAHGLLPIGTPGEIDLARVLADVDALLAVARRFVGERRPPVEVDVDLDSATLSGVLRDVYPKGQAFLRFARLKAKNEVVAWVHHLALQCAAPERGLPTVVLGRASADEARAEARLFDPLDPEVARNRLNELVELYRLGQKAPLAFFPRAAKRYAKAWLDAGGAPERERAALESARRVFQDDRNAPADADDAYVARLFYGVDPFATSPAPFDDDGSLGLPSFPEVARAVFVPLLAASHEERA